MSNDEGFLAMGWKGRVVLGVLCYAAAGNCLGICDAPVLAASASVHCFGKRATIVGQGVVRGTAHADVIVTGRGADRVIGGGGNDRVCTGAGADAIEGGVGSDRIDAGSGSDSVIGGNGSDLVLGGAGSDEVTGKRGNDRLFGGPGNGDFIDAGLGDDTLDGGSGGFDQVIGGVGNDVLSGGPGDNDLLRPDFGRDEVDGGAGAHDTVSFAVSGEGSAVAGGGGVRVDLAAGTVEGDGEDTLHGIEDVIGTAFGDAISGGGGPNVLYGGGGIDELTGVGEGDAASGGTGLDRCRAVATQESCELPGVTPYSAAAEATFLELIQNGGRPPARSPTLEVNLVGSGLTAVVDAAEYLRDMPGIQVAVGFEGDAWLLHATGIGIGSGEGCESPTPGTVRCPIDERPEAILISGSAGDDTLIVEPSVPATAGARLNGYRGSDTLEGAAGDDSLDGYLSTSGDVLRGGGGDDALTAGAILDGGPGSDLLIAYPCRGEIVEGGAGVDSASFARSEHGVEARIGGLAQFVGEPGSFDRGCPPVEGFSATTVSSTVESLEGSPYGDVLIGDGARNILLGRGGDDLVSGEAGDDFLVGGEGFDELYGDGGEDRLYSRDDHVDGPLDCGAGRRAGVISRDPNDPTGRNCRELPMR